MFTSYIVYLGFNFCVCKTEKKKKILKKEKNPGLFEIGSILRTLPNIYNGALWETANGFNYFRNISFPYSLVYKVNMIFLM